MSDYVPDFPDNTHDTTLSPKHIAIVSNLESFHNDLLSRFIGERLNTQCNVIKHEIKKVSSNIRLILIDCLEADKRDLDRTLRELSTQSDDIVTALINAQHEPEHENLLDWPCISGLFYVDTTKEQLIRGIEQLMEGDYWVPRRLLHNFFNKHRQNASGKNHTTQPLTIQLTNREREILKMIRNGMSNSSVSEALKLSEHTVKSHLYNIYKKIGVRNRMEASNWARDHQNLDNL